MPGVVTPLLTLIHDCDTVADWTGTPSADSTVEWQGNACLAKKVSNATSVVMLKPITGSVGQPADFTDVQIYVWMQGLKIAQFDTRANGGMRIVVESGTTAGTWQGVWSVGGSDTYNGGWQNFSIRTSTPFSSSTSTPPNKQFISRVGVQFKTVITSNVLNCYFDVLRYGSEPDGAGGLQIASGTVASPATFQDLIDADSAVANRYGIVESREGAIFVNGRLMIGSTVIGSGTYFKDTSKIVAYKNQASGGFADLKIVGNSGETTKVSFGTGSGGSGISGIVIKSAGNPKFTINATGSTITDLGLYGCTFIDPGIIKLPPFSASIEVLNCSIEAGAVLSASTSVLKNCNIISADSYGVRMTSSDHNITNCSFIGCPDAIHIPQSGTFVFNNLQFVGNTYDVINTSGAPVTASIINTATNPPTSYDPAGSLVVFVNEKTCEFTGLIANSEVRVYNSATDVEIAGIEDSGTTFSFTFTPSGVTAHVHIIKNDYEFVRITGIVLDQNRSIPIQQRFDRNYSNP